MRDEHSSTLWLVALVGVVATAVALWYWLAGPGSGGGGGSGSKPRACAQMLGGREGVCAWYTVDRSSRTVRLVLGLDNTSELRSSWRVLEFALQVDPLRTGLRYSSYWSDHHAASLLGDGSVGEPVLRFGVTRRSDDDDDNDQVLLTVLLEENDDTDALDPTKIQASIVRAVTLSQEGNGRVVARNLQMRPLTVTASERVSNNEFRSTMAVPCEEVTVEGQQCPLVRRKAWNDGQPCTQCNN